MGLQQEIERLSNEAALTAISNDLLAVAHKLRYPMSTILSQVPGDSLAARARAIGVSRQTMYVWAQERFRPSGDQAAAIAQLTGVPIAQIKGYQEGKNDGVGDPARKAVARMEKAGRKLSRGATRLRTKRRRMVVKQGNR